MSVCLHLLLSWLQVLLGKSTCTEKVDMYSYGVVLWEICAGEAPTGRQLRPLRCALTATSRLDATTSSSLFLLVLSLLFCS